ncbi:hypothetical protein A3F37_00275 [Candidatus Saccharibacteria bacterium RIFCSPHIGHO2_12_FULL_41_12]|nr:MAG: hypothetical protein A3F37_00275 [Candidatus Saccharibacteria bacterium RIFCSPHIGHO2_12_FULL_41_12]
MLKKLLKSIVVRIEYYFVAKLLSKNPNVKVVGVVGSVGKSGTKKAVFTVLDQKYSVAWQDGNYNDIVTIPLVFFGLGLPSLFNPFAWLTVFYKMRRSIHNYSNDVVVLELGTDGPGQISEFAKYLKLDIAIVTHISEEHMEYFQTLEAVAQEELDVQHYAKALIVEATSASKFSKYITVEYKTFGPETDAYAHFVVEGRNLDIFIGSKVFACQSNIIGVHQMNNLVAAALVAEYMDLEDSQIENGVSSVLPMAGRMNLFEGKDGSLIVDDTYNSSPDAVVRAINYLASLDMHNKIAVIGNMNEMGEMSSKLHYKVGAQVATRDFTEVLTIGVDANEHLATAIESSGQKVQRFDSPYAVGKYLAQKDLKDTAILFKGSQNGVYLEEAIKYILANKDDKMNLVRQSKQWLNKKKKSFK